LLVSSSLPAINLTNCVFVIVAIEHVLLDSLGINAPLLPSHEKAIAAT
jgi:hypothetical protein